MSTGNYIIIILSLLLLAFVCWKEWQRPNRSRLILRLLASVLLTASFACLALPITKKLEAEGISGKQAVLLTEGFDKDSVSNFLLANKNASVYTVDNTITSLSGNFKTQLLTATDLASLQKEVSIVHVYGYGLDKEQSNEMQFPSVVFHPAKMMDGITAATWQHRIKTGELLKVQGHYVNSSPAEIKLVFSSYDVNLDTAIIPAKSNLNFELSTVPKQLGKAVYKLTALSGKDTIEKEPVPFEIEQPGNVKILVLSASPDFENKFLKTWLSQNNYSLITRTAISKSKYEKTFLNTPNVSIDKITTSLLSDIDLVLADMTELANISKAELSAIESQVSQKGMGLVIRADSASSRNAFYSRPFPVFQGSGEKQKDLSIFIPVTNQYAAVVATGQPVYIRPLPGTQSLIEDRQSNVIVSSSIHGAGRLVYTTLNNTFTWMLSGDNKTYQSYWSYILEKATAKSNVEKSWSLSPAYPYVNKAVDILYTSNDSELPSVQVGEDFVHLSQNPDLPFQWRGYYWPQRSGWHPVMQDNKSTFWWYAYAANDWKTMAVAQRIKNTLQSANIHVQSKSTLNEPLTEPVSKIYFFILFLCCISFLWIEKKL